MVALKTFAIGGIHPDENKITADRPIEELPLPAQVTVPVAQHIGKPAEVVVERGAEVRTGALLAKAAGFISANIHSPVTGKVKKIDLITDAQGHRRTAIVIDVAEEQECAEGVDCSPEVVEEITMEPADIVTRIGEAGIVGAGGATFPTAVKYSIPEGKSVDTLIINGVECEPYLTADHRLMLEMSDELIVGTRILMRTVGVTRAFIAIEENKPDAIEFLTARVAEKAASSAGGTPLSDGGGSGRADGSGPFPEGEIIVQPMKVKYPQGGEKQLIQAITGREVPSGKLPLDVGCIVSNVSTTVSVYYAVQKNRPFIERIVTVTGKHLTEGRNFRVRIGTPVSALIEAVGGIPEGTGKVIMGGPMTGKAISDFAVPITKGSGGIIFVDEAEAHRDAVKNCIRCSSCVTACPMGLEPYLLEKLVQAEKWEEADREGVLDCIECGGCNFSCPSRRPILDYIRLGKATVMAMRRAKK